MGKDMLKDCIKGDGIFFNYGLQLVCMTLIWVVFLVWRTQGYTTGLAITYPVRILLLSLFYCCCEKGKNCRICLLIILVMMAFEQTIRFLIVAVLHNPKFLWGLLDTGY